VDSILKDVLNKGTGRSGSRQRVHFAGGWEDRALRRDGWFAGFTAIWVCVIWIGF